MEYYIIFPIIFIILIPILYLLVADIDAWNSGICKDTGQPWVYFDTTSQGCRGYKSGECVLWISAPLIDRINA